MTLPHAPHPADTIRTTSRKIAEGLSPVTVMEQHLDRIAAQNAACRALILVDAERALAEARRAEQDIRAGNRRGPLHGIPVVVKDNLDVAGWPTTGGSRLWQAGPASATAASLANLLAQGAIILGKANLHELCAGSHANPWFGTVVNPRDAGRGTGGTSSGAAAAVAAGFCLAAVGTDTGGSNRSPAAATGLYGFKPTNGLVDVTGLHSMAPTFDCIGVLARSAWDTRVMAEALAGQALPTSAPVTRARIALCPDLAGQAVDAVVLRAIEDWLDRPDVELAEIRFAQQPEFVAAGLAILQYEFAATYRDPIRAHPDRVGDDVSRFLDDSLRVSAETYRAALALRDARRADMAVRMAGFDAIAIPTSPGLAPRLSDEHTRVNGQMVPWGAAGGGLRRWANMLGMPALAVPLDTPGGLPASVQLGALAGQDAKVLALAEFLDRR